MYDLTTSGLPLVDKPFSEISPEFGVYSVLGREGDLKVIWDKTKPAEVDAARATFDKLRAQNYLAFVATGEKGIAGEQIRTFDPKHERLLFSPQLVGG